MGWRVIFFNILALAIAFSTPSQGSMGYDISAGINSSVLEVHRSTQAMNFEAGGVVDGYGNFSRYSRIRGFAGISVGEQSSSPKQGRIGYADRIALRSREGPVAITASFFSGQGYASDENTQNETQSLSFSEYGDIYVDEKWSTYFSKQKKVIYSGPEIRMRDAYENNGDFVSTDINSWTLSLESLYRTSINRTIISANLTSQAISLEKHSNKSSIYTMNLSSVGSKTRLDAGQLDPSGRTANRISQEYIGQQSMKLRLIMSDWVQKLDDDGGYIECCAESQPSMAKNRSNN